MSLKFNNIKFSSKPWAEHWAGSWTVEEWSVLAFETSDFETGLHMKWLGLRLA